MVVMAFAAVAGMVFVRLVAILSSLIADCTAALSYTLTMTTLFLVSAAIGSCVATLIAPCLFAEFVTTPVPEQTEPTDVSMVAGDVTYASLGVVLMSLAAQHGYEVTWAEVYGLLPRAELFNALPPADSDRLIFNLLRTFLTPRRFALAHNDASRPPRFELVAA